MVVLEKLFLAEDYVAFIDLTSKTETGHPRWSMQELDLCHDTVQEYSPREYEINATARKAWP